MVDSKKSEKKLVWLHDDARLTTPPLPYEVRRDFGYYLRMLQRRNELPARRVAMMRTIGPRVFEIRVRFDGEQYRLIVRNDPEEILAVHAFHKKSKKTPQTVIDLCRRRLSDYDNSR